MEENTAKGLPQWVQLRFGTESFHALGFALTEACPRYPIYAEGGDLGFTSGAPAMEATVRLWYADFQHLIERAPSAEDGQADFTLMRFTVVVSYQNPYDNRELIVERWQDFTPFDYELTLKACRSASIAVSIKGVVASCKREITPAGGSNQPASNRAPWRFHWPQPTVNFDCLRGLRITSYSLHVQRAKPLIQRLDEGGYRIVLGRKQITAVLNLWSTEVHRLLKCYETPYLSAVKSDVSLRASWKNPAHTEERELYSCLLGFSPTKVYRTVSGGVSDLIVRVEGCAQGLQLSESQGSPSAAR